MTERSNINAAISTAMGNVTKLAKEHKNAHGSYNFASIDDFLELCRPMMAAEGLYVNISGTGAETFMAGSNKLWCKFSYIIQTCHKSGESTDEVGMDVMLPLTGAQTSGSAQSYALKQYLRGLLMISTGEKDDPDFHLPAPKDGVDGVVPEVSSKTPEELEAEIKSKKTLVALNQWNQDNAAEITRLQNENTDAFQRLYSVWQEKEKEIQNGST
jgi:hypothetical protein